MFNTMNNSNIDYENLSSEVSDMLKHSKYTRSYNAILAKKLNKSKAIIINQIDYWTSRLRDEKHFHNGIYWVRETYKEWHEQFPEMSVRGIQKTLLSLEEEGFIYVGNFNDRSYDKTKWYAVNYEKVKAVLEENAEKPHEQSSQGPYEQSSSGVHEQSSSPIPKNSIPNVSIPKNKINIVHSAMNAPLIHDIDAYMVDVMSMLNTDANDDICKAIRWFFEKYEDFTGHPHIMLKLSTISSIADDLIPYGDCLRDMMIKYFEDKASEEYCGLPHFASERMLRYLAYEVGRPDTVPNRRYIMD